jgi:hypothetical protein
MKASRDHWGEVPHFILKRPESWNRTPKVAGSTGQSASSTSVESINFLEPGPKFWEFVREREAGLRPATTTEGELKI